MILSSHNNEVQNRGGLKHYPFLLDEFSQNNPTKFEVSFLVSGIRYDIDIKFNSVCVIEENLYSLTD